MRTHAFAVFSAISALLLTIAPTAFAAPEAPAPSVADGTPTIDHDRPMGYYVFRNDDGVHLRTHGPGAEHNFDAVLRSPGLFENVDVIRLEEGDHVDVKDGGHTLIIHFHTFDFTDGVNFKIRDGERLRLNLKIDNDQISTNNIFLGANGTHPEHNPFTIRL